MHNEANTEPAAQKQYNISANEIHKDESNLVDHKQITNTPFTITGNKTVGWFLRMGDYRITEFKDTMQEAEDEIYIKPWEITLRLIAVCQDLDEKRRNEKK